MLMSIHVSAHTNITTPLLALSTERASHDSPAALSTSIKTARGVGSIVLCQKRKEELREDGTRQKERGAGLKGLPMVKSGILRAKQKIIKNYDPWNQVKHHKSARL